MSKNIYKIPRSIRLKIAPQQEINNVIKFNPFYISQVYCLNCQKPVQWFFKRVVDFILSLAVIIILSPLMLIVAIVIKLDSPGPIIFKQKRLGLFGKEFYMYKFRSMFVDAENQLNNLVSLNETNNKMFKIFKDPRVTRVGKFIRKFSIDELPQLFNVLKGEMSLVGFRPPLASEVEKYERHHYIRFATMPGLTGIWQVSGRSRIKDFNQVINLEKNYLANWSFALDLKIMLKTIPVVLLGKDAA